MKQKVLRKWKMKMETLSPKENGNSATCPSNGNLKFNVQKIDRVAFVVGGLLFLSFNVIYWLTFLMFNFN